MLFRFPPRKIDLANSAITQFSQSLPISGRFIWVLNSLIRAFLTPVSQKNIFWLLEISFLGLLLKAGRRKMTNVCSNRSRYRSTVTLEIFNVLANSFTETTEPA